jgi:hypothetical protein
VKSIGQIALATILLALSGSPVLANGGGDMATMYRPGLPMETLHFFTGVVPATPTEGLVLTDDNCQPDAKGISHCLNKVKFPNGDTVIFVHDHMMDHGNMHMKGGTPCIVPGDHAWFIKGAAAAMKMP